MVGGWELGIITSGDDDASGKVQGYGRVCSEEAEYGRAIHCNAADYVTTQGDGTNARGMGRNRW